MVSVIIPAYNAEEFIEETVRSVLEQTYKDLEIIVVDDGSPDNLGDIVQGIQKEDDRIQYYRKPNGGVSSARNIGYGHAKGEYLSFLDADDKWKPERIEKIISAFENAPKEVGLIHTDMKFMNEDSIPIEGSNTGLSGYVLDELLLWDQCVIPAPGSCIIKRSVLEDVGLFDERLSTAADQEIFIRITSKYSVIRINEELGFGRILQNSMSRSNISVIETDHILTYKIAEKLDLFKSISFKRKCFSNLYLILAGTWWKNGNNKKRGLKFIMMALIQWPPNIVKLLKKKI